MAESVRLIDPNDLARNPENPRLIFRQEELEALQKSIAQQGILVPLTVFRENSQYRLLDGERRWRCSLKLGLSSVPVIVQPKPDRLQNLMMMFAIHNARRDWDPLPTAIKLQEIEGEFERRNGKKPTELELAGLASLNRGEVRRLKKLLGLPTEYRQELLDELEKPRSKQEITVDHVLEVTKGVGALRKRDLVDSVEEDQLRKALLKKFRTGVVKNTVEPRKLARLARGFERGEVSQPKARKVIQRLIDDPDFGIESAFRQSVEQVDYEHGIEQMVLRLIDRLDEHEKRAYEASEELLELMTKLEKRIRAFKNG